jgi:2-C-methyl-D-erythritol 2,4-cyclodiphosphate synthase
MRVGTGFDVHAFGPGDFIMLGGVRVPHAHGVIAHSDGDVALHALCDALLGEHFANHDPRWRGAASGHFVTEVLAMLAPLGLRIGNVDITVLAETPKVAPHREAMRAQIAGLLRVARERVNVKATTTEGLGFLGRAEGIAAQAVVLLYEAADAAET